MVSKLSIWKRIAPVIWPNNERVTEEDLTTALKEIGVTVWVIGNMYQFSDTTDGGVLSIVSTESRDDREVLAERYVRSALVEYNLIHDHMDWGLIKYLVSMMLVPPNTLPYYRKRGAHTPQMWAAIFDVDIAHVHRVIEAEKEHREKCHSSKGL